MWDEVYLETCCRAALHRLNLCGPLGRPADMKDTACLSRLVGIGLASRREDGRYEITQAGRERHDVEIARR